jgi:hypothetical protein
MEPSKVAEVLQSIVDEVIPEDVKDHDRLAALRAAIPLVTAPRLVPWVEHAGLWQCVNRHFFVTKPGDPIVCKSCEVEAALEASQRTNAEWLAANAPGGWIDDLRKAQSK